MELILEIHIFIQKIMKYTKYLTDMINWKKYFKDNLTWFNLLFCVFYFN